MKRRRLGSFPRLASTQIQAHSFPLVMSKCDNLVRVRIKKKFSPNVLVLFFLFGKVKE